MSGVTVPSSRELRRRSVSFRASRLRWPEWVVGISAAFLLISLVGLTWFTFLHPSGGAGTKFYVSTSEDGWNGLSGARWLLLITILFAFALFVFQATQRSPAIPVTLSVLVTILAGLSAIWLIIRVLIDPPGGRNLGGWLALVSAAVLAWAAYRSVRMEGIDPEDGPGEIPIVTSEEMAREQASEPDPHS